MATRVETHLVDDLDGQTADETVMFGLDGTIFEIDLTREHAGELRASLGTYAKAARPVAKSRLKTSEIRIPNRAGRSPARRDREQTAAIRAWANAHGYTVGAKGRIPESVANAYETAHA